jgi:hypothetical protein
MGNSLCLACVVTKDKYNVKRAATLPGVQGVRDRFERSRGERSPVKKKVFSVQLVLPALLNLWLLTVHHRECDGGFVGFLLVGIWFSEGRYGSNALQQGGDVMQ